MHELKQQVMTTEERTSLSQNFKSCIPPPQKKRVKKVDFETDSEKKKKKGGGGGGCTVSDRDRQSIPNLQFKAREFVKTMLFPVGLASHASHSKQNICKCYIYTHFSRKTPHSKRTIKGIKLKNSKQTTIFSNCTIEKIVFSML